MKVETLNVIVNLQNKYMALMGAVDLLVNNGWRPGRAVRHVLIKNKIIDVNYEKACVSTANLYSKIVKDVCEHWNHTRFDGHFFQITTDATVVQRAYEEVSSCVSSDAHLMHSCYIEPDVGMFLCIITNEHGDIVSRAWARASGESALFYSNYGYEHRMESILIAIGAKFTKKWANDVISHLRCTGVVIDPITLGSSVMEYTPIIDGFTMEPIYQAHCM